MNGWVMGFLGIFWAIGLSILAYGGYSLMRARQAESWPRTNGTLLDCELKTHHSDGTTWNVDVKYVYNVNNREYQGTRLAFGYAGSNSRQEHDAVYRKLKPAKTVKVLYDPSDPSKAVLAAGTNRSIQFMLIFGATWTAFIGGFTLLMLIGSQKDSSLVDRVTVVESRAEPVGTR